MDAVHEDQPVIYGGQPHVLREEAKGRGFEMPRIQLNTEMLNRARELPRRAPAGAIEAPLDRLPPAALALWTWAQSEPLLELARSAEADWSPEELVRMHQDRLRDRASLGDLPLIVLARTAGGFSDGMSIPADVLERNRRAFQADLAALSRSGRLVFAARCRTQHPPRGSQSRCPVDSGARDDHPIPACQRKTTATFWILKVSVPATSGPRSGPRDEKARLAEEIQRTTSCSHRSHPTSTCGGHTHLERDRT